LLYCCLLRIVIVEFPTFRAWSLTVRINAINVRGWYQLSLVKLHKTNEAILNASPEYSSTNKVYILSAIVSQTASYTIQNASFPSRLTLHFLDCICDL